MKFITFYENCIIFQGRPCFCLSIELLSTVFSKLTGFEPVTSTAGDWRIYSYSLLCIMPVILYSETLSIYICSIFNLYDSSSFFFHLCEKERALASESTRSHDRIHFFSIGPFRTLICESCSCGKEWSRFLRALPSHLGLPLSPAVRRLVDEHGLNPNVIPASGPRGRLLKGFACSFLILIGGPSQ